jgi:hypothetical protein
MHYRYEHFQRFVAHATHVFPETSLHVRLASDMVARETMSVSFTTHTSRCCKVRQLIVRKWSQALCLANSPWSRTCHVWTVSCTHTSHSLLSAFCFFKLFIILLGKACRTDHVRAYHSVMQQQLRKHIMFCTPCVQCRSS